MLQVWILWNSCHPLTKSNVIFLLISLVNPMIHLINIKRVFLFTSIEIFYSLHLILKNLIEKIKRCLPNTPYLYTPLLTPFNLFYLPRCHPSFSLAKALYKHSFYIFFLIPHLLNPSSLMKILQYGSQIKLLSIKDTISQLSSREL